MLDQKNRNKESEMAFEEFFNGVLSRLMSDSEREIINAPFIKKLMFIAFISGSSFELSQEVTRLREKISKMEAEKNGA